MNTDFEKTYQMMREELQRVQEAILETAKAADEAAESDVMEKLLVHLDNLIRHRNRLAGTIDVLLEGALSLAIEPDTEEGPGPEKLLEEAISSMSTNGAWSELGKAMGEGIRDRIEHPPEGKISDFVETWKESFKARVDKDPNFL